MLKAPTVFVLGAGAGVDIEMLVGETLSTQIGDKLDIRFETGHLKYGNPDVVESLRHYTNERKENFNEYRQAGVLIKKGVHYSRSIDSFINSHKHNEKLAVCAKLGIVHTIFEYERRSAVYRPPNKSFKNEDKVRSSWLSELFNLLLRDIYVAENLHEVFKNLTIINFNYDRCIQQFFFHALCEWSQKSESEIAAIVGKLRIYHPYGTVGELPWSQGNKPKAEFGGEEHDDRLDRYIASIKTFHEQIEEGDELNMMRQAVWAAKRVIFLGFHFHPQNMDLLQLPEATKEMLPRVFATVKERSRADIDVIVGRIKQSLRRTAAGDIVRTFEGDCKGLFREYQAMWGD